MLLLPLSMTQQQTRQQQRQRSSKQQRTSARSVLCAGGRASSSAEGASRSSTARRRARRAIGSSTSCSVTRHDAEATTAATEQTPLATGVNSCVAAKLPPCFIHLRRPFARNTVLSLFVCLSIMLLMEESSKAFEVCGAHNRYLHLLAI